MNGTKGVMPMVFNISRTSRILNPILPVQMPPVRRTLSLTEKLDRDPSILCADAENYSNKDYVMAMSKLYYRIAKSTNVPAKDLMKFNLSDLEFALAKLAKEQRQEYKDLCKYWGVVPEEKRSKHVTKGINPEAHLLRLTDWGYIELFFANMKSIVEMVARKTYSSHNMSDLEKAKYAQIFVLFIVGNSLMFYDYMNFQRVEETLKARGGSVDQKKLEEAVLEKTMEEEKKVRRNGGLLYEMYNLYLSGLENGAINIDAIDFFLDMVDYDHKLIIKEFMDMLTVYSEDYNERTDFRSRHLAPIKNNFDIRLLKEKLFPCGLWGSDISLFLTTIPEEKRKSYSYAFNRFKRYHYAFGEKVDSWETPEHYIHPASKAEFQIHGYVYSRSPIEIRISDENELWLMRMV